jgi:diaminopimelate decarboxylase
MSEKKVPFTLGQAKALIEKYPTPFHIYDEQAILANAERLKKAFAWNKGFREFFAVKACPNPHIMKLLKGVGFGADASSLPELLLAEKTGIPGSYIMFTSNDTPANEYGKAAKLDAISDFSKSTSDCPGSSPSATTLARFAEATP